MDHPPHPFYERGSPGAGVDRITTDPDGWDRRWTV